MTRLLLSLLVIFMPLFSSSVIAEQQMAKLYYSNQRVAMREVATWLVDGNSPICNRVLNKANAAAFHRQSLNAALENSVGGNFVGTTREEFATEMGKRIGNTFSNDYYVFCTPFASSDWLDFLTQD